MTDKRALRNGYRQSFVPIGVFAIRNTVNQRVFVGGSRNVEGAMNRARFELTSGAHRNAALLADWKQFGAQAFRFDVLDLVKESQNPDIDYDAELAALLVMWRDELPCYGDSGPAPPDAPSATAR